MFKAVKRVVIALWIGNASGRDLLSGVIRYVQDFGGWQITLLQLPNGFSPSLVEQIQANGMDGLITNDPENETVLELLRFHPVPVTMIGPEDDYKLPPQCPLELIGTDDYNLGVLGARHFLSLGRFNSYGFIRQDTARAGNRSMREIGFTDTLTKGGHRCLNFEDFRISKSTNYLDAMAKWIDHLPKPAAVMCFYDMIAVQVLETCRRLGVAVPSQVSILGIDNDILLCESTSPTISSIHPDHEQIGYLAARRLNQMLGGRVGARQKAVKFHHSIVDRETTSSLSPSAYLVQRALDFIRQRACRGIKVSDVALRLGISRRLLDLRFREIEKRSVHGAIEDLKLQTASRLLRNSTLAISRIASSCGYGSLQAFKTAFYKRHKLSPSQYRTIPEKSLHATRF